eukprot:1194355-Prorocentrum_minimum.AAC.4
MRGRDRRGTAMMPELYPNWNMPVEAAAVRPASITGGGQAHSRKVREFGVCGEASSVRLKIPKESIFSLPFRDWCPLRVCSLFPSAIGGRRVSRSVKVTLGWLDPDLQLDSRSSSWLLDPAAYHVLKISCGEERLLLFLSAAPLSVRSSDEGMPDRHLEMRSLRAVDTHPT